MISSKIKIPEKEALDETYPILKIDSRGNLVILFLAPKKGIIVGGADDMYRRFGEYRKNWHEDNFKIFTGSVEISNEK